MLGVAAIVECDAEHLADFGGGHGLALGLVDPVLTPRRLGGIAHIEMLPTMPWVSIAGSPSGPEAVPENRVANASPGRMGICCCATAGAVSVKHNRADDCRA